MTRNEAYNLQKGDRVCFRKMVLSVDKIEIRRPVGTVIIKTLDGNSHEFFASDLREI